MAADESGSAAPALASRRSLRPLWQLDPAIRHLNHGAFGACPLEILEEQAEWRRRMEANPTRFFMVELPKALRRTAEEIAPWLGTRPERLAFIENVTAGTSAVLRSLDFMPGDEILTTDHVYNAVRNTLRYVASRTGAVAIEAPMPEPLANSQQALDVITASITARTRLIVIDHIASASAATFPVAEIAAAARARGIPILVDGAHAPGSIDLDIDAIGADWYVGNCHKWLCAPRGSAFIVVADRPTFEIHPLAISHAYGQGFPAEFDKIGTRDASAWLSIPAAIRFHERLGGAALRCRNRGLALEIAQAITRDVGYAAAAADGLCQSLIALKLPLARAAAREDAGAVHDYLYDQHGIETGVTVLKGALHLRFSVAAYNEASDYAGLGAATRDALEQLA
ncbi:MAG: aminotransferase class V-fold PLP-dependent enzyme [Methylobacterium sp.]|nr:aminotransferase class V-fold PLP-dependent enzyme [Methylobacterium sp.]MCA3602341.1 aminotransferase class V-fold PLP-dependent enzyme [Methylobacterium sp.]MCA3613941.1 aminotransferase class V-fold PLP-dependent enzyme [Methylobacterium sp.]MCA4909805.1 aminotransferase class V-fold PLP-dependent enzyme [Methylobacterium sp.]